MEAPNKELAHKTARALFDLHLALGAARAVLDEDRVIARPLLTAAISDTQYWNDALSAGKKQARKLLQNALVSARRLMNLAGNRHGTEIGTLAAEMMDHIQHVLCCLLQHGNYASNEDRMGARHAVETPWQLSSVAISHFLLTQASSGGEK